RHAGQKLARHFGQERAREYVVNVARARLDLLAAAGDLVNDRLVVREGRAVVLGEATADAFELEADDEAHHLVGDGVVGDDGHAAEERRLEDLEQFGAYDLADDFRLRQAVRLGAQ